LASVELRLGGRPSVAATGTGSTVSLSQYTVPAKARSLYDKAAEFMRRDKLEDSLKKVNAALAIYPKFAEALILRGVLEQNAGKLAEAIADFQQAIQDDPSYPYGYLALASLHNSTGHYKESLLILAKAEQLAPSAWQTYFELSRAELQKGDFSNALHHLDHASELQGGPKKEAPELHLIRGYALIGLTQIPEAMHELETFLARKPNGEPSDQARKILEQLRGAAITAGR